MATELAELKHDDLKEPVRIAFEIAFQSERDWKAWVEVNLAERVSSAEDVTKALEEAKAHFRLEIFHRLDVQLTEEETQSCITMMDLFRAVETVLARTVREDAEAAERSKSFFEN